MQTHSEDDALMHEAAALARRICRQIADGGGAADDLRRWSALLVGAAVSFWHSAGLPADRIRDEFTDALRVALEVADPRDARSAVKH